ncbi:SLAIN motif-containing protein-like [Kryptolebias marmoratus]|uniref:SLAIN motif-containing protein-like n=1 Tax=Kryptolebias marmoratus TaxID=37003 RepID=A0A3Q3AMD6_KRYMA|nr:SLAIN motif-containing protein-like [Kryptolebias marmoratus]
MELQDHTKSYWSQYFCNQPQMEYDVSVSRYRLGSIELEEHPDPYCTVRTDSEPARVKNGRSFAMDARMRLDSLKSGCKSPCCDMDIKLYKYNSEKDLWVGEDSQTEESALDLVEILDLEDSMLDEESWLYEPQSKQSLVEKESAFRWCRHVLDNPSPEMEAARRVLMSKLDQRSRYNFYRPAAGSHHSPSVSSGDETSGSTSISDSESLDHNEGNLSHNSITTSYRLQDITDVHIMARIQEDSLRQEYVSIPSAAPFRGNSEMQGTYDFASGNKTKASSSSSSCWEAAPPLLSSSCCDSAMSASKQGCQSPKLSRLHQQVTQFKLLRLAQNPEASPGRTRSPLQTSLRSLQAVRNSRSLEADDHHFSFSPAGGPSPRPGSGHCGSPSLSATSLNLNNSMRGTSTRISAMKTLQRSQSISPSRIAHPAKGYLPAHGRVFASPERPTTAAWGRRGPSVQR